MIKKLLYLNDKLTSGITFREILLFVAIVSIANAKCSLLGLLIIVEMQLMQLYSTVDWNLIKPKLAFYSSWRKMVLNYSSVFCSAVGIKLFYIVLFANIAFDRKSTLLFQVVFFFLVLPIFSNRLVRWNTTRAI